MDGWGTQFYLNVLQQQSKEVDSFTLTILCKTGSYKALAP